VPLSAQTSIVPTLGGMGKFCVPRRARAAVMTAFQIGAAPVRPLVPTIGELSVLPCQTPTTTVGV